MQQAAEAAHMLSNKLPQIEDNPLHILCGTSTVKTAIPRSDMYGVHVVILCMFMNLWPRFRESAMYGSSYTYDWHTINSVDAAAARNR